jgi:hypothetical protein
VLRCHPLLVALTLVGCATTDNVWLHRDHSDPARLKADSAQCDHVAAASVQVRNPSTSSLYGVGNPVFGNRDPQFGDTFDAAFQNCMRSLGYYFGPR